MMNKTLIFSFLIFFGCMSDDNHNMGNHVEERISQVSADTLNDSLKEESAIDKRQNRTENIGFISFLFEFAKGILVIFASFFFIAILYFLYKNYRSRIRELKNEIEYLKSKVDKQKRIQEKTKFEINREFEILKREISKNYERIEKWNTKIDTSARSNSDNLVSNKEQFIRTKIDEEQSKKSVKEPLFITKSFTVPNEDGRFDNRRSVDDSSGNMIYFRITYKDGRNIGKLDYNQGRMDQSAIDKRDSILKPVCDIKNPDIVNPSKINQISSGEVLLTDGFWSVKDKVQIEFI